MTLPGVVVENQDARAPRGANLVLSTVFLTGELTRGPNSPVFIRSLKDLQKNHGDRTADTASVHDFVDAFFREGGSRIGVVPLRGPATAQATHDFVDGSSATALTVKAKTPGTDGNRTSVDIDTGVTSGTFIVKTYRDDVLVETSPELVDGAAAAAWAESSSRWVSITDGVGGDPVATGSPADLTGGDDDFDGITTTEIQAALDLFTKDLGPGSVVLPGRTATAAQLLAQAHAASHNRLARHQAVESSSAADLIAQAATLRAADGADVADLLAPRVNIPGLAAGGAGRSVEATALRCAAEAVNDQAGISPNQPAAGRWALADYATSPTQTWGEDDLSDLNDAGVNVTRIVDGQLQVYGARTLADPTTDQVGVRLGSARFRMAIGEIARQRLQAETFAELDAGGIELGNLRGLTRGAIDSFAGSLDHLTVDADLADNGDGTYTVELQVEYATVPDAETIRLTLTRQLPEV